ncbi:MAG: HEPN domain-containing protein [Euryarchaeota archaeon]|nr:HEPN domain-containing protein [Euryarchaeota archaeon]
MKEAASLIERARKYLESSEMLIEKGDNESSVSRSYYAMFFSAEAALLTKEMAFSSHKGVISSFGETFILPGIFPKEMGRWINIAFEKRQLGDYEYTFVISAGEAKEILSNARAFVENVVSYLKKMKAV